MIHVRLPLRSFERAVTAAGEAADQERRPGRNPAGFFLPTLVSLLQSEKTGIPYRMDIVLNIPESPAQMQNEKPEKIMGHIQKAGLLTQKLEEAGLQKRFITAGLSEGKEGYLDLYFRRYEPFNLLGGEEEESQETVP